MINGEGKGRERILNGGSWIFDIGYWNFRTGKSLF